MTEVAAVERPFDYLVTDATSQVGVGDRVRVDFNHRSVRGWVIGEAPVSAELKPLVKWLGYGPPPSLLELLAWAGVRWYGPLSRLLLASSPKRLVTQLPSVPVASALASSVLLDAPQYAPGVIEVSPTTDPLSLILAAYEMTRERSGSLLVLVPTEAWATRLRGRLEQRGCAVASGDGEWDRVRAGWPVVVGARSTALAPVPQVCGAVVLDADDEAYRSQASPTWEVTSMLRERCARDNAPLWCTSTMPSASLVNDEPVQQWSDAAGWPRIEVVDRRGSDPHEGVLGAAALGAAHRALRGDDAVAVCVVLQRLGTGRLFACHRCGEVARCATCHQAEVDHDGQMACADLHELRANFCRQCGVTNLKPVRVGVTTLARDVANQLGQVVSEVTASSDADARLARVVVGTEAIWQRVRRCGVVIFVDFDQYLLAPRASARHRAVAAVGKAGRLVGSRREGRGAVVLQTRRGEDPVLASLVRGDVHDLVVEDVQTARLLSLPPYGAMAEVSGHGADAFVAALPATVRVSSGPSPFIVRAPDVSTLTSALASTTRPAGRLRVAVT